MVLLSNIRPIRRLTPTYYLISSHCLMKNFASKISNKEAL